MTASSGLFQSPHTPGIVDVGYNAIISVLYHDYGSAHRSPGSETDSHRVMFRKTSVILNMAGARKGFMGLISRSSLN
jgi:hypothetical protein